MTHGPIDPKLEALKRRAEGLRADRGTLNSHLEEVAEVIYPSGMGFVGTRTNGEKRMQKVYDETGIHANEVLAASMGSFATNASSKWFALRMVNRKIGEQHHVKAWLSDVQDALYEEMYSPDTGIQTALDEMYLQLGAFGTSPLFIGETSKGGLMFQCRALSECYVAENPDGVIDTLYRFFSWTVRQVVENWGLDKVSDKVKKLWDEKKLDARIELCHGVIPREYTGLKGKKNMPFASIYFEVATCHMLEESGFPEFPYAVPRWRKSANEIYGRSPGMTALPGVKMLQASEASLIRVMHKMADPAIFLRDDSTVGQVRTIPGAINFWRGNPNEGVMKYPTTDRMPEVQDWIEGVRNRVRNIFHNDLLQVMEDREMTATETTIRRRERMRLQAPTLGRLDAELLGPMISRIYAMLDRAGKLPPPPDDIDGEPVSIEFVSPLATAQKQDALAGLYQVFDYFAPLGEAGLKVIGERVDLGRLLDHVWDVLNLEPDLLKSADEQEAMAKQEAMVNGVAMAGPVADAANKGAGAIKQLADASAGGGIDMNQLAAMAANGGQG